MSYRFTFTLNDSDYYEANKFHLIRWLWNRQPKKSLEKLKRDGKITYQKESTYNFGDDGYAMTTPDSSSTSNYTVFERVGDGSKGIYLFKTVNSALIIPNRAFGSAGERADFLAFIKSKITTGDH